MALTAGTHLGPYEIQSALGAGGMGEVYRGYDTKLNRAVAIKVLLAEVASNPERLARFRREAQVLASLNHPHIAQIYGLQESGDVTALVMELVEGPTLADLIKSHPRGLPLDEALPIARQVAAALEAAHEQGIVHRDLKPANIKVRPDGSAKVLDFGLAKAFDPIHKAGDREHGISQSPTLTTPAMTAAGFVLGTAAYMAPEQARGKPVDKRADVWAFGCVLFEMLSGTRAFAGDEISDTLAAVLRADPEWNRIPADTPEAIRSLVAGCLEKDRERRVSDMAVAKFVLESRGTQVARTAPTVGRRGRSPWWQWLAVAAASAAAGAIFAAAVDRWPSRSVTAQRTARFGVSTTPETAPGRTGGDHDIAISRDGNRIAYVNSTGAILLRSLDQLEAQPIRGLDGARGPFFSPDGQSLGFFDATGSLKKITIAGGTPTAIAPVVGNPRGATWLDDDTIVFATNDPATGLWRVPAAGGQPAVLTTPDPTKQGDHVWPHAVPDAHAVLFTLVPARPTDNPQTVLLDLDSGTMTTLLDGATDARYLTSGHLAYVVATTALDAMIRAVPFDLSRKRALNPAIDVATSRAAGPLSANFDVSANGTLVYQPIVPATRPRLLQWVDRQGHIDPIAAPPRAYLYARISPDGRRVALDARDEQSDIWIWEFARQALTRLTIDPSIDRFPAWAPDGRSIFFTSERDGPPNVYRQAVDATSPAERISTHPNAQAVMSVTPDGKAVLVRESAPGFDLVLLPLEGASPAKPLVKTAFLEQNGEVSPDGRWLAYESNDSGQFQIYVRPFPNVDRNRWLVSNAGGTMPLWSRDGHELYFLAPTGNLMVARIRGGSDWAAEQPTRLPVVVDYQNAIGGAARSYDIGTDGRFLVIKNPGAPGTTPFGLVIVMNWFEELARLAPPK